jgi:thiopeptide-type bacteriocin biosynthesis protein
VPVHPSSTASPEQILDAVRAALAGDELADLAAARSLPVEQLQAALTAYHAAGEAAVERSTHRWYTTRLTFTDPRHAEKTMATVVGPMLDTVCVGTLPVAWWYLRWEGDWRVRLRHPDPAVLKAFLDDLGKGRRVAASAPRLHDPDMGPYGGPVGTAIASGLWVEECRSILAYVATSLPMERRDLSIAVLDVLLTAAGLSFPARGAVYAQAAALGPAEPAGARLLATKLHRFLTDPLVGVTAGTGPWGDACVIAGVQFAAAATAGQLSRPIIDVLAAVVRAQWARLGLSTAAQAVLAHAAHDAYTR